MKTSKVFNFKPKELSIPKSCAELLKEFKQREEKSKGEKLKFGGVGNKDVYNITAPFEVDGVVYILGRVESRNSETDTQSMFFVKENNVWIPDKSKPIFKMQDPFFTKIDDEIIIGGVEIFLVSDQENDNRLTWKMVFYKGKSLNDLKKFAEGPNGMKDVRIKKLLNDKIGVFTRHGSIGSRKKDGIGGKIGFTIIDSLDELNAENINKAEIIEGLFTKEEWGGVNEFYLLDNDKIGALGHIAYFDDERNKHYYAMVFSFDLKSKQISGQKIIVSAECFGRGEAKRKDLEDIVYSGGLEVRDNEVIWYGGIRDVETGRKKVGNSLKDLFS